MPTPDFLALSAGDFHSCGIKIDGTAACWGFDGNGQSSPTSGPQSVDANTRFLALSAGGSHSCGIKTDSRAVCWGNNDSDRANPASSLQGVDANTGFLAVSAGGWHSCGIKGDGTAACWGFDGNNQSSPTSSPQGVDANTRFLAISAGGAYTCGIKADGRAACWGFDGNSRTSPTSSLQGIDANTRFLAISAGGTHSCAIKADSSAACWGFNNDGQTSPPPDRFNQAPDVFRLAELTTALTTRDGGEPVQFNEVTEIELLHPRLTLKEGESATPTLLRALSDLTTPVTITVGEYDEQFLSIAPTQFTLNGRGETAAASIMAMDNDEYAHIEPIHVRLSVTGDNTRLTPTETITVIVENDELYTVGFEEEDITLAEGTSVTVRLSISPPILLGANPVTVALLSSDEEHLTADPFVTFAAGATSASAAIGAADDAYKERGETHTVRLIIPERTPARASSDTLNVAVLPDQQDNSILVTVNPTSLTLMTGRAESITFMVPERFAIDGKATVRLTIEGDIEVEPIRVTLDEAMREQSARVEAMRGAVPIDPGADMEPRAATVSLSVTGDPEDPRLVPDDIIRILIEESPGIRIKVRVYLEGALP